MIAAFALQPAALPALFEILLKFMIIWAEGLYQGMCARLTIKQSDIFVV